MTTKFLQFVIVSMMFKDCWPPAYNLSHLSLIPASPALCMATYFSKLNCFFNKYESLKEKKEINLRRALSIKIKMDIHRVSLSIKFELLFESNRCRNLWESFFISLSVQHLSAATNQRIWIFSTTDRDVSPL